MGINKMSNLKHIEQLSKITDETRKRVEGELPAFFRDLIELHDKIREIIDVINKLSI